VGGKWIHRLTNKNAKTKTAVCEVCGPVEIRKKSNTWRCLNSVRRSRHKPGEWRKYQRAPCGLTWDEAKAFRQGKCCAICSTTDDLNVDHCHTTQKIRGVLCGYCNRGLGNFKDSKELLESAIKYLSQ
jgi:hypothetical protein